MDKADELASIAAQLAARVRDDDPEAVHRWLAKVVDPADWMALAIVLAAAVPNDRTWRQLTAWTRVTAVKPRAPKPPQDLKPHGTSAAAKRHRYYDEPLCADCKAWDRERKRVERAHRVRPQPVDEHGRAA